MDRPSTRRRNVHRGEVALLRQGVKGAFKVMSLLVAVASRDPRPSVLEIFCGQGGLTSSAQGEGWAPLQPVDVLYGDDLRSSDCRREIMEVIGTQKPDLVVMAPPCTPWSSWQRLGDQAKVQAKQQHDMVFWRFL